MTQPTTTPEMVGRCARAACEARSVGGMAKVSDTDRRIARAVIAAMRNAPFSVLLAMINVTDDGNGELHRRKWNAAIDAALQDDAA